jgi:hypothetical protein
MPMFNPCKPCCNTFKCGDKCIGGGVTNFAEGKFLDGYRSVGGPFSIQPSESSGHPNALYVDVGNSGSYFKQLKADAIMKSRRISFNCAAIGNRYGTIPAGVFEQSVGIFLENTVRIYSKYRWEDGEVVSFGYYYALGVDEYGNGGTVFGPFLGGDTTSFGGGGGFNIIIEADLVVENQYIMYFNIGSGKITNAIVINLEFDPDVALNVGMWCVNGGGWYSFCAVSNNQADKCYPCAGCSQKSEFPNTYLLSVPNLTNDYCDSCKFLSDDFVLKYVGGFGWNEFILGLPNTDAIVSMSCGWATMDATGDPCPNITLPVNSPYEEDGRQGYLWVLYMAYNGASVKTMFLVATSWRYIGGDSPSASSPTGLSYPFGSSAQVLATYTLPVSSWNCSGPNTLVFKQENCRRWYEAAIPPATGTVERNACKNMPSTLTVFPILTD